MEHLVNYSNILNFGYKTMHQFMFLYIVSSNIIPRNYHYVEECKVFYYSFESVLLFSDTENIIFRNMEITMSR